METMKPAATLPGQVDPADVGFDADRLARIDRHFDRYLEDGRLAGWQALVSRRGKVAHFARQGLRDKESSLPVEPDTIYRIYSMTKPITSVAAMMLWEEGAFELSTPVHRFIPSFKDVRVYVRGYSTNPLTEPAVEPIRIWHLLTHTSGLTYAFLHANALEEGYRAAGFEIATPPGVDLASACDIFASQPLLFQPGTEWNYSYSVDVLGRVIEVVSGQTLDRFFAERIFEPLGMVDTGFWVPEADQPRLAALYATAPGLPGPVRYDVLGEIALKRPDLLQGGGGLVSTMSDYHRFTQMLLRRGELDGKRLLAPKTVAYMTQNHLPGGADLKSFGRPFDATTTLDGLGFGLGFSVLLDPVREKLPGSPGSFAWGGLASTYFWVDPVEELTAIFMTQLVPSSTHPIRSELRQLVYQSLID